MEKDKDASEVPGDAILRQMREDTGKKKHLDQQKLRAQSALQRAIDARDEAAFAEAPSALGIEPKSQIGQAHMQSFRQLPAKRY